MKLEGISPKDLLINGFDFYKKHKLGVEFQCVLSDKLIEKLESMGIKKLGGTRVALILMQLLSVTMNFSLKILVRLSFLFMQTEKCLTKRLKIIFKQED